MERPARTSRSDQDPARAQAQGPRPKGGVVFNPENLRRKARVVITIPEPETGRLIWALGRVGRFALSTSGLWAASFVGHART